MRFVRFLRSYEGVKRGCRSIGLLIGFICSVCSPRVDTSPNSSSGHSLPSAKSATLFADRNRATEQREVGGEEIGFEADEFEVGATVAVPQRRRPRGASLGRFSGSNVPRWGSARHAGEPSHIWIDQLSYRNSWEAHEDFHETFEDVVRNPEPIGEARHTSA